MRYIEKKVSVWRSLLLTIMLVNASLIPDLCAQENGIHLDEKDVSIKDVLRKIERMNGYFFLYNNNLIDVERKIDIQVSNAVIDEVIPLIFSNQKVNYVIHDRQIVLSPYELQAFKGREYIAQGRVIDEQGQPLIGVAIGVLGTTRGTITNMEGQFKIELDRPVAELIFTFVGMNTIRFDYQGEEDIQVVMSAKNQLIDEVIVVAYGRQAAMTVTGAVHSINMQKVENAGVPQVANLVQGVAPGLLVINSSGMPGEKPKMRIHGEGSFNYSNEPLWVIDGIIYGHSSPDINPTDIESVSVLKDAAATALYGSRASNGIIMVETKVGKSGHNAFTFNSNVGVTQLNQGRFQMMNGKELYDYTIGFVNDQNQFTMPDPDSDNVLKSTNWLDIVSKTGVVQDYNLSYEGGRKGVLIYANLGYFEEKGAVIGHEWNKISGRINFDYQVSEKVKMEARLSGVFQDRFNKENGMLHYSYLMLPWDNPYHEDGSIKLITSDDSSIEWYSRYQLNPLYDQQYNYTQSKNYQYMSDLKLELKLTDWLSFSSANRLHNTHSRYESIVDARTSAGIANNGSIENHYAQRHYFSTSNIFRFNIEQEKHHLFGLAAYEYSKSYFNNMNGAGRGVYFDLETLNNTSVPMWLNGTKSESAFLSGLCNFQYNYDQKYMMNASFRSDGSSRFGKNNRFGNFYSVGLAWALHREKFMSAAGFIDHLRIRASYGSVGNANINEYVAYGVYNMNNVQYNGEPGGHPRRLSNPDLTWESNYNANFAIDAGLFRRLNLTLDIYSKKTANLIQDIPMPLVSGFYWYTDNVGSIQNRGIDILLEGSIAEGRSFEWRANFNVSFNKNKVIELNEGEEIFIGNKIIHEGWDMNTLYLRKWVGVNPENGDPLWEKVVIDENGDEVIEITNNYSDATMQPVGSTSPEFFGGFSNTLRYKRLSMIADFNFVYGNQIYNSYRELFDNDGAYPSYNSMKLHSGWKRWEKPGDEATHPKPVFQGNRLSNKSSSRYIEDGSYIRLRQLVLRYTLPEKYINRIGLKTAELSVSGANLWTWANFSGMDPEVGIEGYSQALYPVTRKFMLGVDISF
ncbi:SusC/RagA family TonB-linked outer membrane protein [Carboxylicivirga mesophila]|uniref:SusC/RagA family TonB-linked outer membrane protein n=1 Tax=Carboxylicivirga mesophila TaxID=1166478 RepID=A0ABS5K893_9BACT|nr:SusC/RagA family TonB-linked outer membrane protein [Carboxylicivirga mesophila]MBS2211122.1 SusC/RagA family TonB-linked outer membrane protein [Carboxylicivirga mesophila]